MASVRRARRHVSVVEYLDGETTAAVRSEFIGGEVFAMASASEAHNDLVVRLVQWLAERLPQDCRVFSQSTKLRVDFRSHEDYFYPDVFVSCGPRDPRAHVRQDATLVIEVLSPTTERVDRGEKFMAYTSLPSLHDYILVSQDTQHIEVFRHNNDWKREVLGSSDQIMLVSIGHALSVSDIYRDIQL
jgi:Uma2 family endonuclease